MNIVIIDSKTEEQIFSYDGKDLASAVPQKKEQIIVDQEWYDVVKRVISFRKVRVNNNECSFYVLMQTVYLWVKKAPFKTQSLGVLPSLHPESK